jgi:hypothetical protein
MAFVTRSALVEDSEASIVSAAMLPRLSRSTSPRQYPSKFGHFTQTVEHPITSLPAVPSPTTCSIKIGPPRGSTLVDVASSVSNKATSGLMSATITTDDNGSDDDWAYEQILPGGPLVNWSKFLRSLPEPCVTDMSIDAEIRHEWLMHDCYLVTRGYKTGIFCTKEEVAQVTRGVQSVVYQGAFRKCLHRLVKAKQTRCIENIDYIDYAV